MCIIVYVPYTRFVSLRMTKYINNLYCFSKFIFKFFAPYACATFSSPYKVMRLAVMWSTILHGIRLTCWIACLYYKTFNISTNKVIYYNRSPLWCWPELESIPLRFLVNIIMGSCFCNLCIHSNIYLWNILSL